MIELERQGSVWIFRSETSESGIAELRICWNSWNEIPDPGDLGAWFALFGEVFGVADDGFTLVEKGEVLWEYGPPGEFEGEE